MGYGGPAATAAALRHKERQVVALAGDGCFLMNGQELATAVAHGADMLVIVIDNGAYGTIRMHQEREFPGRLSGTTLKNPAFTALARAYGCWAAPVERTAAFAPADRKSVQSGKSGSVRVALRGRSILHKKKDPSVATKKQL